MKKSATKNYTLEYHRVPICYDVSRRLYMVKNSDGFFDEGFSTLQGAIEHIYYGWSGKEVEQCLLF